MNKDQKLLEEAYQKILNEETNLEKALDNIERETEASLAERKRKEGEKMKDLSQIVSGQLGTETKRNFVYAASLYKPKEFYKSFLDDLFDKDLKEVPHNSPVKEGMLWTEQDVNTIKVFRATNVDGRLMKVEVPAEEVKSKGLTSLISERKLQQKADRHHKGNIDLARGRHMLSGSVDFFAKFYSKEQIHRALDALLKAYAIMQDLHDKLTKAYAIKFKQRERDSNLSKDFNISALEDF